MNKKVKQRKNKQQQDIEATRTDFYLEQIATGQPYFPPAGKVSSRGAGIISSHTDPTPFVFSMATYKRLALNEHLLDTFISMLDLEPSLIKNHPNYQALRSIGALAA